METWKLDLDGVYECPFGFWDFSIPIVLPDRQVLGKVLAGQALSDQQKDEEIWEKTSLPGFDDKLSGRFFHVSKEKPGRKCREPGPFEINHILILLRKAM